MLFEVGDANAAMERLPLLYVSRLGAMGVGSGGRGGGGYC